MRHLGKENPYNKSMKTPRIKKSSSVYGSYPFDMPKELIIEVTLESHIQIITKEAPCLTRRKMKQAGSIYGSCFDSIYSENLTSRDSNYIKSEHPDILNIKDPSLNQQLKTGMKLTTNKSSLQSNPHDQVYVYIVTCGGYGYDRIQAIYVGIANIEDFTFSQKKTSQIATIKPDSFKKRFCLIYQEGVRNEISAAS